MEELERTELSAVSSFTSSHSVRLVNSTCRIEQSVVSDRFPVQNGRGFFQFFFGQLQYSYLANCKKFDDDVMGQDLFLYG